MPGASRSGRRSRVWLTGSLPQYRYRFKSPPVYPVRLDTHRPVVHLPADPVQVDLGVRVVPCRPTNVCGWAAAGGRMGEERPKPRLNDSASRSLPDWSSGLDRRT